jgi:tRNA threonylcarbamoyladenosine biosynthesis protein TsaE
MGDVVVTTSSARETELLGARCGVLLRGGDRVLLHGELGGGKTQFVRGLVEGLGHDDPREVSSPTFAICHRYEGGRLPLDHLDLYRLEMGPALERQGVLDPLDDPDAVTVIEWAERLSERPSGVVLEVWFEHDPRGEDWRRIRLRPASAENGRFSDVIGVPSSGESDP